MSSVTWDQSNSSVGTFRLPSASSQKHTCSLLHPETIGMLWNYHHLSTIVCLCKRILNTWKVQWMWQKCKECYHIHTTRSTKGHTYRCKGNMYKGILDMLRKSSPVISEQVPQWDDAVKPQWRVSPLLSAWNTTSVLSMETKPSPRLSRLFPPYHRPLNSVFLRLFLTQTRFSWFWHKVMQNRKHIYVTGAVHVPYMWPHWTASWKTTLLSIMLII